MKDDTSEAPGTPGPDDGKRAAEAAEIRRLSERLLALTKQMQSGVAYCEQADWERAGIPVRIARELKHLRVGINGARTETGAIALLLERAGIATGAEYLEACCLMMEREVDSYERELIGRYGGKVSIRLGEAGGI